MNNSMPRTDLSTTAEETIPYIPPMKVGDIFARTISISYKPDTDATAIIVSGKKITRIIDLTESALVEECIDLLTVPNALAPAAFNAAQICNGNPIPPDETVYIRQTSDKVTDIYIGLLPFTLPTAL
ncbi:hypothetical protein [Pseudomonas putida]|uniref:hypothetical protein n=1 Tax=Pseudomonas TaxID=286 RepID=UPI003466CBBF